VILLAIALGYCAGGALADRLKQVKPLGVLLLCSGGLTYLVPAFGAEVIAKIIGRHPAEQEIPAIWQKLDPALGSAAVFFVPCLALAALPPALIKCATKRLDRVGTISGLIYAASTVGGIAGVFLSGYFLLELMSLSNIFRVMGLLTVGLGGLCLVVREWLPQEREPGPGQSPKTPP
jgi:MFS family permease